MDKQLFDKIRKLMTAALADFQMIEPNDRVLVAVSGGKDSSTMLLGLREIQRKSPIPFSIQPAILDQKQPGFDVDAFRKWTKEQGFDLIVLEEDTYSVVKEKTEPGRSYCGLCSRLRRGIFYTYASRHGFTKIALGHHRDDLNETLLLNLFYGGKIATMSPFMTAQDGRNTIIRPMAYVPEKHIQAFATSMEIPIIPCRLCGNQDGLKRARIKSFLKEMEQEYDQLGTSMLSAMGHVAKDMLLDSCLRSDGRGPTDRRQLNTNSDLGM
jgi:tRNA 2-thiocytidine biosynthesis protein TtcA